MITKQREIKSGIMEIEGPEVKEEIILRVEFEDIKREAEYYAKIIMDVYRLNSSAKISYNSNFGVHIKG